MDNNRRDDVNSRSDNGARSFDGVVLSNPTPDDERSGDTAFTQPGRASNTGSGISGSAAELADEQNTWQRTPYTRREYAAPRSEESLPVSGSIYSIEFHQPPERRKSASSSRNDNRVDVLSLGDPDTDGHTERATRDSMFIPRWILDPKPPIGHHGDFSGVTPPKLKSGSFAKSSPSHRESEDMDFREEEIILLDTNTAFGSAYSALGYNESQSLANKENSKQAKNAIKLADRLVSVPLSKVWQVFSELVVNLMVLLNVVVAVVDIGLGPQYLYYKVTALLLGLVENVVTVSMWAVRHHPKFKNSDERMRLEKYQQYVENVLGETLIQPLLAVTVLGFTSDKMYKSGSAFLYVQVALIACDVVTMLYNGVLRMHMLRRLMKDLGAVLDTGKKRATWRLSGYILPRCYWTIISNVILTLVLTVMFGIQTNLDNYNTSNYRLTVSSSLIMIVLILLPTASLLLFFVSNLFWIMEMLLKINIGVGANLDFQEKLREEYGDTISDALQYSRTKIEATEKRLATIQEASTTTKLLYCLYEIQFVALIFVWQWMLLAAMYFFDGFENNNFNLIMKMTFVLLFIAANPHLALLMVLNNFMILALVLGTIVYPICLPLCCKTKSPSKYSELMSKGETS
ncbi:hypothetical protein LSH36_144g05041 [Paralvinella palmiformis]|uniref:Transmembrane protein n=1 Tax=Paralvinella palmiformis TaxID=53620 RepID=A0AAD9JUX7_9ANNE|nr:hypothetical protein LSH36_144g05041 [Paralvinella palmiformis]